MSSYLTNLIDKAFLLKKTELFNSLDMDLLLAIADRTETYSFKPGCDIFTIGQPGFNLYIISEGFVSILNKDKEILDSLKPEDCFGEEHLFSTDLRTYTAKARTFVTLLGLSKGQFLSILEECPSVSLALLELYAKQIIYRKRV